MANKENRQRCVLVCAYISVLIVGILIGLIPFIVQYVSNSQADRDTLRQFVMHQEKLYNFTDKSPITMAVSSRANKIVIRKSGAAVGSETVKMSCGGKIKMARVTWNNIVAKKRTLEQFDTYCINNMKTIDKINICDVSMKLVFNWKFNSTDSFTKVDYNCEETL